MKKEIQSLNDKKSKNRGKKWILCILASRCVWCLHRNLKFREKTVHRDAKMQKTRKKRGKWVEKMGKVFDGKFEKQILTQQLKNSKFSEKSQFSGQK